jgi:hypothetical protein
MKDPFPRGIARQVAGPALSEAENHFRCDKCGGWFDTRDLDGLRIAKGRCRIRHLICQ